MKKFVMTEEAIRTICDLWAKRSSVEIALILGTSAQVVRHRARIMGLKRTVDVRPSRKRLPTKSVNDEIPPFARPWLTRQSGECPFAYGLKGNIHSCCRPKAPGRGYCAEHQRDVYPAPEIDFRSVRKYL